MAVFALGEALAGISEGGTTTVKTIGIVISRLEFGSVVSLAPLSVQPSRVHGLLHREKDLQSYLFTVIANPSRNADRTQREGECFLEKQVSVSCSSLESFWRIPLSPCRLLTHKPER